MTDATPPSPPEVPAAPGTSHPAAPASAKAVQQFVYTGVTEEQRPILVADLWRAGALRVDVAREASGTTYTVTATLPA